ncbi:MAG: hypothetical protein ABI461_14350, partial [Polyangiaceae bacterium]
MSARLTLAQSPTTAPTTDSEDRASDWHWQIRNAVTTVDALEKALPLTARELDGARRAESQGMPIGITPYYLTLCDPHDASCPIRLQCVPDARENEPVHGDLVDPLGEVAHQA